MALDDQMRDAAAGGGAPDATLGRAFGTPAGMTPEDIEARSELGRFIPKASLPGDRDDLIAGATEMNAPDEVIDVLSRLPEGEVYDTVYQAWAALGGRNEDPSRRP
ncbi:DUF2795 domain-containing protein [Dactylosporangium sucinum]|uniref:DUF2795 domain-containing protein n=1 Tax=Dactylosporangium sucinum TaxID=1424081 RepID=A0A917WLZ9_9ACTN|nr:hypothetical protein GCM10007977_013950 [Dactylosporangium sucinum]